MSTQKKFKLTAKKVPAIPRNERLRQAGASAVSVTASAGDWLPRSEFDALFERVPGEDGGYTIRAKGDGLWADGFVSAQGANPEAANAPSVQVLLPSEMGNALDPASREETFNAATIYGLAERIAALEAAEPASGGGATPTSIPWGAVSGKPRWILDAPFLPQAGGILGGSLHIDNANLFVDGIAEAETMRAQFLETSDLEAASANGLRITAQGVTIAAEGHPAPLSCGDIDCEAVRADSVRASGYISCLGSASASDSRLKRILGAVGLSVEEIAAAPSVRFEWLGGEGEAVGTIAQYWERVLPQAVHEREGYLSLEYGQVGVAAAIALARRVLQLEDRVNSLLNNFAHEN